MMNIRNEEEIKDRKNKLYLQEVYEGIEKYVWMSFSSPFKEKGHQFLGVVITKAFGKTHAMWKSHELGINPGGEILFMLAPVEDYNASEKKRMEAHLDRLLSCEELEKAGFEPEDCS